MIEPNLVTAKERCKAGKTGDTSIFTEDLPSLAQPLPVLSVDHKHDSVAIVVITVPYRAHAALAAKIKEIENRRRKTDLSH